MPLLRAVALGAGPLYLLFAGLGYVLGVGIAKYLGYPLQVREAALGLLIALLLQSAMDWLANAFRPSHADLAESEGSEGRAQIRKAALYGAIGALATAAALAYSVLKLEGAPVAAWSCMGLSTALILLHSAPPTRAADKGFGALLVAAQIAYLTPTLAFLLQAGSLHPLLIWCILALTLLLISSLIALELPSYGEDDRRARATILTRLGWERGLSLHHGLLFACYLVLGLSVWLGFSFRLIGPAFLTLPFAILQVLILRGIVRGARPMWKVLRANAVALYALTAYFLTLSFWLG